ncbi:angiogenic factor with G patch and FHA domains 1 isoform X1 [Condylostylus longicornis]|uniref:angiogenic factor with G patch and FHA domains 1 isoform X1 n=1 Tax=Condylostylus longicornis TaxID=2530218 RepID=UPI00244DC07B|nr:angiogenic factor with G patch and FHA domains 1 isoform X1 [Condylostylus longicornis]
MNSCTDNEAISKDDKKEKFYVIKNMKKLKEMDYKEIIDYVKNLHKFVEKREKKLKKYKEKVKIWQKKYRKIKKGFTGANFNESDSSFVSSKNSEKELTKKENEKLNDNVNFIDEIRQVAETTQNENGFVYEPTSGLYYDQKTGYYYNAEYGLYYDGNTGCYYKFNQDKNEFEFHSQIHPQSSKIDQAQQQNDDYNRNYHGDERIVNDGEQDFLLSKSNRRGLKRKPNKRRKIYRSEDDSDDFIVPENREDGEISSSDSEKDNVQNYDIAHIQDIAKKYPPSLRIIVQETNLDKIKVGTLYIVTFKGGTLGREGNHDVVLPDINISKFHLKFSYDEKKEIYQCVDLGSRNGTLLNGRRISSAKQESELTDITHGSILQISQTKLMCHIHSGNTTCGLCEPGLLIETRDVEKMELLSHKQQLKKLQKRYGLENEKYTEKKSNLSEKYKDRASDRRAKVGSSSQHEKTEIASTETQIANTNKGFKLLSKLGWKEGESLGKDKDGLVEPIKVVANEGTIGLGCKEVNYPVLSQTKIKKVNQWKKVQERYNNISKADIFCDSKSSSDSA